MHISPFIILPNTCFLRVFKHESARRCCKNLLPNCVILQYIFAPFCERGGPPLLVLQKGSFLQHGKTVCACFAIRLLSKDSWRPSLCVVSVPLLPKLLLLLAGDGAGRGGAWKAKRNFFAVVRAVAVKRFDGARYLDRICHGFISKG